MKYRYTINTTYNNWYYSLHMRTLQDLSCYCVISWNWWTLLWCHISAFSRWGHEPVSNWQTFPLSDVNDRACRSEEVKQQIDVGMRRRRFPVIDIRWFLLLLVHAPYWVDLAGELVVCRVYIYMLSVDIVRPRDRRAYAKMGVFHLYT